MKKSPLLTEDGLLILRPEDEPIHNESLGVPQLPAILRLEDTSDTLRGILHDLTDSGKLKTRCSLIGRSGHSQVGLDVELGRDSPEICTRKRLVEIPIVLTSLNRDIPDILFAELKILSDRGLQPKIARLFLPLDAPLNRAEIESAIGKHHLLLPSHAEIQEEGIIEIPLENVRYFLSTTLLTAGQNAQHVLLQSKEGLSLIQYLSRGGLPELLNSRDFMVGAIRISLGPYLAVFERQLNNPEIIHLAARLLDGVRTSGIDVPRQIEVYNASDNAIDPRTLKIKMRLYPADPATAKVASRIFVPERAENIIRFGVDFADVTDILNLEVCRPLFDNLSASPYDRGNYARILSRNKCLEIQRELENGEWYEHAQNRVIYEVIRGKITSGERRGDQIPPDLRGFVDSLESVGRSQNLRKVYVSQHFPVTDTLRVLKRNNIGVFVGRSIRTEKEVNGHTADLRTPRTNFYFDQTTYETFCDLASKDGVRFYMLFGNGGESHVREFYRGFWVAKGIKERLINTHTVIAMFGSHVEGTEEVLSEQIHAFLKEMKKLPGFDGRFAVCHGAGPGLMRIVDNAADSLKILRIGIGIDSEKIGQQANLRPPVLVNFKNSARHLRQNLLDRTSHCKIFNIGGMGTFEELLIAITNLKLFENLPAPHIFVDPFGLGEDGEHLWKSAIEQFKIAAATKTMSGNEVRLAPDWIPKFCHLVRSYDEALGIIKDFIQDPAGYWRMTGIPTADLGVAYRNVKAADITIPPYIDKAIQDLKV